MKNKLKKLSKLILVYLLIIVSGCQNEEVGNKVNLVSKNLGFKPNTVSPNDIPEVMAFVNKNIGDITSKATRSGETISGAIFEGDDVFEIINQGKNSNYSFRFTYKETPDNVLYNLVVSVSATGEKTASVIKYTCNPADYPVFRKKMFDFNFFKGTIEYHKYTDYFGNSAIFNKSAADCVTTTSYSGAGITDINGGVQTSTIPSYLTSDPINGYYYPPETYTEYVYVVTIASGTSTGTGGCCSCGKCGAHYVLDPSQHKSTNKSAIDCPDLIPAGFVAVNNFDLLIDLKKYLLLTQDEFVFLRSRGDEVFGLYGFLYFSINSIDTFDQRVVIAKEVLNKLRLNPSTTINDVIDNFLQLTPQETLWLNKIENKLIKDQITKFVSDNVFSGDTRKIAKEMINLAVNEPNQADVNSLVNLTLLFEQNGNNLFTDDFNKVLDPYIDLDLNASIDLTTPLPTYTNFISIKVFLDYKKLRKLNPEWTRTKCLWHASREVVHLSLDAFGLIPVAGEVFDLANGALYVIDGDGVNASLSLASAIPIIGWGSASAKFGLKIVSTSTGVTKLVWKITANGIEFGNRSQLRKILGITDTGIHAHHVMPWSDLIKNHPVIQKAANSISKFHMNEELNGIAVAAWRNQPNHNTYNNLIKSKLDALPSNLTPDQAYKALTTLINKIKLTIKNNPNTHLNNLIF